MSRNLCQTVCTFCGATPALVEKPRPITFIDAGCHVNDHKELIVANAQCRTCGARYLAWVSHPIWKAYPAGGSAFFDLSYRSTFNDQFGEDDLPTRWEAVVKFERERLEKRRADCVEERDAYDIRIVEINVELAALTVASVKERHTP